MDFWGAVVGGAKAVWDWGKGAVMDYAADVDWKDVAETFADERITAAQSGGSGGRRGRSISLPGRYSLDVVNPSAASQSSGIKTAGTNAAEIANAKWRARFIRARRDAAGTVGTGARTITSRTYMKRPKELG
jgi:hypothetical protein